MVKHDVEVENTIFTESELCEKLGVTKATLAKWRSLGKAPPSSKKGRVRFYWDIEKWIVGSHSVAHTPVAHQWIPSAQPPARQPNAAVQAAAFRPRAACPVPVRIPSARGYCGHRSKDRRDIAGPECTTCPKCLTSGQAFKSKFSFWEVPIALMGIRPLRCQRCMHRFFGKLIERTENARTMPPTSVFRPQLVKTRPKPHSPFGWIYGAASGSGVPHEDRRELKTAA